MLIVSPSFYKIASQAIQDDTRETIEIPHADRTVFIRIYGKSVEHVHAYRFHCQPIAMRPGNAFRFGAIA